MDPSKDTLDTEPAPPPSGALLPVIPAGRAEERVKAALDDMCGAYLRLEGLALACARALDQAAAKGQP